MEFFVYPDPFAMRYAVSFVDSFGGIGRYNPLCPEVTEIRNGVLILLANLIINIVVGMMKLLGAT